MTEGKDSVSEFVFDFNRVTYVDFMEFLKSAKDDNEDKADLSFKFQAQVTASWPFDQDISVEGIKHLGLLDFKKFQKEFTVALEAMDKEAKN